MAKRIKEYTPGTISTENTGVIEAISARPKLILFYMVKYYCRSGKKSKPIKAS